MYQLEHMVRKPARPPRADALAARLAVAIKRVHGRLREAAWAGAGEAELPGAQVTVIGRLRNDGPSTAAVLAAAEHVSHQAITQTVAALKRAGLVRSTPHPKDGRKSVISVTPAGNRLFEAAKGSRDAWLAGAIGQVVSPRERAALEKAIELLERLADAEHQQPGRKMGEEA
jgi:DNA-binding MarR family transcriptional regulator